MKLISLRIEEDQYNELKDLSLIYHKDYSEIIREGVDSVIDKMKKDPWYTVQKAMDNIPVMEQDEEEEMIRELDSLTEEDMEIVETRTRKI